MKERIRHILDLLRPYQDVICFAVAMLLANQVWKWMIDGDEGTDRVTWLGLDVTALFDYLAAQTADSVYALVALCRDSIDRVDAVTLRFLTTGTGSHIVWSCTPVKQLFIWLMVMLATPMATYGLPAMTRRETWLAWCVRLGWILAGALLLYGFNILRISIITLFIEYHPQWFKLLHTYIFKYLFYGFMFLLWVVYVEKIKNSVR